MGLVTASESRGDEREVYLPAEELGMAHRSYVSPDRKSVVAVSQDALAGMAALPSAAAGWQLCQNSDWSGWSLHIGSLVARWKVDTSHNFRTERKRMASRWRRMVSR